MKSESKSIRYSQLLQRSEANLLLCWLMKDCGWVLQFPFVCLPGAVVSSILMLHILVINLKSGDTLGTSHTLFELLWLTGNSVWLFSEMFFDGATAHLPWNYKPLADADPAMYEQGCTIAMIFLVVGFGLFATFYLSVIIRRCMGIFPWGSENLVFDCIPMHAYNRCFIGLWIAKDIIWLHERYRAAVLMGICAFLLIADATRRSRNTPNQSGVPLLIVEMLWIGGNICWITEEVKLQETHPILRIMVATVFMIGIAMTFPQTSVSSAFASVALPSETSALVREAVSHEGDLVPARV